MALAEIIYGQVVLVSPMITMIHNKKVESAVAIGSFLSATGLAFTSLLISEDHDIASGVIMMCAQFLMLCASIFGLDYKFTELINRHEKERNS